MVSITYILRDPSSCNNICKFLVIFPFPRFGLAFKSHPTLVTEERGVLLREL